MRPTRGASQVPPNRMHRLWALVQVWVTRFLQGGATKFDAPGWRRPYEPRAPARDEPSGGKRNHGFARILTCRHTSNSRVVHVRTDVVFAPAPRPLAAARRPRHVHRSASVPP